MTYRQFVKKYEGTKGLLTSTTEGSANCCYVFSVNHPDGYHVLAQVHPEFALFRFEASVFMTAVPLTMLVLDIPSTAGC
jgi:hypothetical protein